MPPYNQSTISDAELTGLIAYMRTLPNMTCMAPRNEEELQPMLEHALSLEGPVYRLAEG